MCTFLLMSDTVDCRGWWWWWLTHLVGFPLRVVMTRKERRNM